MKLIYIIKNRLIKLAKLLMPKKYFQAIRNRLGVEEFIKSKNDRDYIHSVDIIVCVHNALDDVKRCLSSIERSTKFPHRVIIVNDGSNDETSRYLNEYNSIRKNSNIINSEVATGYTKAANRGLKQSDAPLVVLLNSDTIVSNGWLNEIIQCFENDKSIGIAGPLSNAASWQSVPRRFSKSGDWEVNQLPVGWSVDDMGDLVKETTSYIYPRVPFVNGFCYAIRREVINRIGYLDEKTFPKGYGEENDYCIRTEKAGINLAIVDSSYVYHSKSRSFTHDVRKILSKEGSIGLKQKHGEEFVKKQIELIRNNKELLSIQRKIDTEIAKEMKVNPTRFIRILFLLPVSGGGGGVHSIVQDACGMIDLGAKVKIAVPVKHIKSFRNRYKDVDPSLFVAYIPNKFNRYACNFDVVVATIFTSVKLLQSLAIQVPNLKLAYYIQDYEPWITEKNSDLCKEAELSYTLIPGMFLFAKTDWICNIVKEHHGVTVNKVTPSLNTNIYYPDVSKIYKNEKSKNTINLIAMIRPRTPRRGAETTMDILCKIKEIYKENVSISIFGCLDQDINYYHLNSNFKYTNHEVLSQQEVAQLLRESHIFVDFSKYQAFGRTALEAMSCGCVTIVPEKGGAYEYAIDQENCLIVDTSSREKMTNSLIMLIEDYALFTKIRTNGIKTAHNYSIFKAALSELALFKQLFE